MKKLFAALAALALTFVMAASPAKAAPVTTRFGTFGTGTTTCSGITLQGLYTNDIVNGQVVVRASGGGGYWSNGYLRDLWIDEYQYGSRVLPGRYIHYTGSAKSVSVQNISTSYLRWLPNVYDYSTVMSVRIHTTTAACSGTWIIGNP